MKKVLIALDYNPVSEQVAKAGHKLAKQLNAQVCLIHVLTDVSYYGMQYPTFMGYDGYNISADMNMSTEMRNFAEEFLKTATDHLEDPNAGYHLAEGETDTALLNYAEEWNADLIVMGTHSHSTLEKLLVGTIASRVLEKTKIPVYMVPIKKE
ncbi:universal stress protein [Autumnicola psychrophila]|uniref:Universal stress protein n=1 Tax=Autumnicola psychrophila TaxID=3075592 RepID=A0ABU3DPT7_9FLAO|nr:universal stress protein [Zunongwangia sp. F225]MDT0685727.1 universal stress protein [Zunongwangia sp. F225]